MKPLLFLLLSTMALLAVEDTLPPELVRLQELRTREVNKINEVYLKALKTLKADLMKKEDLDGANKVNQEIDKYSPDSSNKAKVETTRWTWGEGGVLVLEENGIARHTGWGNLNGTWKKLADGSIHMKGGNEIIFTITFTADGIGKVANNISDRITTITPIK